MSKQVTRLTTPVLIKAGNFWDGLTDQALGYREILIENGMISKVSTSIDCSGELKVIDLLGCTVMPGFIDCHQHLTLRPSMFGKFWRYSSAHKALCGVDALNRNLMNGAKCIAQSGVSIAFGTDLGILSYDINPACEFHEMVTNGINSLRALKVATSVAADLLQLQDRGVLSPGKNADIVAMAENPFDDIRATESVCFVMKEGVTFKETSNDMYSKSKIKQEEN